MSKEKLGIGLMGAWQDHIYRFADCILTNGQAKGNFRHWKQAEYADCRIVSVWDDDQARGQKLADHCGCPYFSDVEQFLADPELDAVIMCAPTVDHGKYTVMAANAGKHVFMEKAPFVTLEDAYLAREAIRRNGVHYMVSSPMEKPRNRYVQQMIQSGVLGDISEIRFRLYDNFCIGRTEAVGIFNKEENGGGAMIDYGQHGVHITSWLLNARPIRCSASFSYVTDFAKEHQIEDNATAIYEFEGGAIGVVESGWCAPVHECVLDVCGTKGTVHLIGDDKLHLPDGTTEDHDILTYTLDGQNWVTVPESEFPAPTFHYPLRHWIEAILNDTPDDRQDIEEAVLWTEMLAAAYRSAGNTEPIL